MIPAELDRGAFLDLARRRLLREPGPAAVPFPGIENTRPAAVLVPVVGRPGEVTVLLTVRAAALRHHAAQIAFPGGKVDAGDGSPLAAALREAEEEIGLHRTHIEPLGYLDSYPTPSGFTVVPVVGWVEPGFTLAPNGEEVDEVFEVPFHFLMDVGNHQRHAREWQGTLRHYYAMPYGERYIWGVTANIIRNLYEKLYAP